MVREMSENIIDNANSLRHKVLMSMAIVIGSFAVFLVGWNLYFDNYSLALVEVVLVAACVYTGRQIYLQTLTFRQSLLLPYGFIGVVVYGTYLKELSSGLFIWSFMAPTLFYLLLGKRHGFLATLVIALVQLVNAIYKPGSLVLLDGSVGLNVTLAYISIWVISHVYESNREQTQRQLITLALQDPLTKANNRLALNHEFKHLVVIPDALSIVLLDIDFFKDVNDKHGHEAGDMVLINLTKILAQQLTAKRVFRIGGEEFALLISGTREQASAYAERIRQQVEESVFQHQQAGIRITISIGIAERNQEKTLSSLLRKADVNLYAAKHYGRNQVVAAG